MSTASKLPAPVDAIAESRSRTLDFREAMARIRPCEDIADALASPGLADAWAEAIAASWQVACDAQRLDATQPLYIVDLAPAGGHFARLLLIALREQLRRRDGAGWQPRYLACVSASPGDVAAQFDGTLLDDPWFQPVAWNPSQLDSDATPTFLNGQPWHANGNPVTVVALGYLQRFPGRLCAVNYGSWLEGRARIVGREAQGYMLAYDWHEMSRQQQQTLPALLRQRYLRRLSNAAVRIPEEGLRTLERIAVLSAGRFLWLAADQGVADVNTMRFGALAPPTRWQQHDDVLAVNFHALACVQAEQGAWTQHWQRDDTGVVVQAIWRDGSHAVSGTDAGAIADRLDAFHPHDAIHYQQLANALPADTEPAPWLSLLRAAHYDPSVLHPALSRWIDAPPLLDEAERASWGVAITRATERCPHGDEASLLRHGLAVFAVHLGCLDLAEYLFDIDANHTCVALCQALGGRLPAALRRLALGDPQNVSVRALHDEWRARQQRWASLPWYAGELAAEDGLILEPLGTEHAESFFQQYRDPEIGVLTRLPDIDSLDATRAWIVEQQAEPGRATYAVVHMDRGFVGIVSMHCCADSGYFYFWMGSDYQGNGYGRRAGRLLQAQASAYGIRRLFTSAYPDNIRSLDALSELGFERLPAVALPPDEDLLFFVHRLPPPMADRRAVDAIERLLGLLAATGSPIRIDTRQALSAQIEKADICSTGAAS